MQYVSKTFMDNRLDLNQLSLSLVSRQSLLLSVTIKLVSSANRIVIADSSVSAGRSLCIVKTTMVSVQCPVVYHVEF
jgi:hypothetical protein